MTRFRPCIDLHGGRVKQIVGGTLGDLRGENHPVENFVSSRPASYFAEIYRRDALGGGHVIMLGSGNSEAALGALATFPGGLQVGGGITPDNAAGFLDAGASHVIVTSWLFEGAKFSFGRLEALRSAVGASRLVVDLSCRRTGDGWRVAKDRWQTLTDFAIAPENLDRLVGTCDELLVHAADVEGMQAGIDEGLVAMLGHWGAMPVTYAGGARTADDLPHFDALSGGAVDLTIGSALDLFGGTGARYADCLAWNRRTGMTQP
ncbi:hypothetical protein BH23VER1_BH23VER1_22360 [soil metagenome]